MFIAYLVVTVLAAIANAFSATLDFVRYQKILIAMAKAGVPESWLYPRPRLRHSRPATDLLHFVWFWQGY